MSRRVTMSERLDDTKRTIANLETHLANARASRNQERGVVQSVQAEAREAENQRKRAALTAATFAIDVLRLCGTATEDDCMVCNPESQTPMRYGRRCRAHVAEQYLLEAFR